MWKKQKNGKREEGKERKRPVCQFLIEVVREGTDGGMDMDPLALSGKADRGALLPLPLPPSKNQMEIK